MSPAPQTDGVWKPGPNSCPFRYPDDPFMFIAWRDFLSFAIRSKEPDLKAAFEHDTGIKFLPPPKNGLEAMIDKACDADGQIVVAFIEWLNITQWGEDEVQEHPLPSDYHPPEGRK